MADATLATYLRERMAVYDATLDTTAGSKFDREVLQPLLTRLGDSPLDVDLTQLVQDTVEQQDPNVLVRPGSALHDLLVRFLTTAFDPLKRELRFGRVGASMDNATSMTRAELDARMGNFFLGLDAGRKSVIKVRAEYRTPRAVAVTPLTEFKIGTNRYYPTSTQSVTSSGMSFNRTTTGKYYLDITVEAEVAGTSYDPTVGQLVTSTELTDTEKIAVLSVTTRGVDAETVAEAVARTEESITQRTLVTVSGIKVVLPDASNFPELGHIVVVGFGDDEMDRDVVQGPVTVSDIPGGILGLSPPDVGPGGQIHIGGKTDVYIQGTLVEYAVDVDNPANLGRFIIESDTGYTLSDADQGVDQLHDDYVTFDLVLKDQPGYVAALGLDSVTGTGYYLRVGGNEFGIQLRDPQFLQVYTDAASVDYPVAFAPVGIGSKDPSGVAIRSAANVVELTDDTNPLPYAIYFRDFRGDDTGFGHARGFIADVPLWSLVALDTSGNPVLDSNGDPVAQKPGDPNLAQLLDTSANPIPESEVYFIEDPKAVGTFQQGPNVSRTNGQVPMVRVSKVEVIDPLTDEVLDTIPYGAPLRVEALDPIAIGGSGTVRYWFESQASVAVFRDRHAATVLKSGSQVLFPKPLVAYSGAKPAGVGAGSWLSDYDFVDANGDVLATYRVQVTGLTKTLPLFDGAGVAIAVPGVAQGLRRAIRPGDRLVYWRSTAYDDAVVATIKTVNSNSLEVYWPSTSNPPAATTGWTANKADFAIVPGWRATDSLLHADSGYYYVDFEFEAPATNTAAVAQGAELTWLTEADSASFDTAIPAAVQSPARIEGYLEQPQNSVLSFSRFERPHLRLTWTVGDDTFLFDPRGLGTAVGAPRLRVTHLAATGLQAVEDFTRASANRPIGEELLIRHFPPALVTAKLQYRGGETEATTKTAVETFLKAADPEVGLEVSDLVDVVADLGATYIKMPVTLYVRWMDRARVRRLEVVTDSRTLNRLLQTYPDADRLSVTKLG